MNKITKMFSTPISIGAGWSDVTSGGRNEIVFERLNKTYGAYEIRTNYDRTLLKAFAGTGLFIALLCAVLLFSRAIPVTEMKVPSTDSTALKLIEKERVFMEQHQEQHKAQPKQESDFPVVTRDTVQDKDTVQFIASNNPNNGDSKDTADTGTGPLTGGGGSKLLDEDTTTYDGPILEEPPTFPGGDEALLRFLKKNISYPEYAKEIGGKGIVGISFVIDKEGNVTDVTVAKSTRFADLNNEALRVVKKLPKWNCGKQQGRAVKVRMILPIRFELKQ